MASEKDFRVKNGIIVTSGNVVIGDTTVIDSNRNLLNVTSAGFSQNSYVNILLSNTNSYIATKLNSSSYTAADVQSKAALANTNAYIAAKTDESASLLRLSNTNSYIATKLNSSSYTAADVQSKAALANTNTYIATKANTASPTFTGTPAAPTASVGTNTAQLATTAFVRTEVSALVNAAPSTLDTLNELAAALGDDPDFATTVTASIGTKAANSYVNILLSNTNAYIATKLAASSYTTADVQSKAALANTNSYVATKTDESTSLLRLSNTNSYIATKLNSSSYTTADVQVKAALANTNSYIATKTDESTSLLRLSNTNSYIATKLATSSYTTADVQVKAALANTNSYIATVQSDVDANEATERAALSNTNSYIATKTDESTSLLRLSNTNSYIATKLNSSSYTAADVQSKAALANTNNYIASVQSDVDANEATERAALSNTNSYIATKLNSSSYTAADVQSKAALANTNSYIATKLATSSYTAADVQVKAALANTNTYIATKLNSSSYTAADVQSKAALANTNTYIATKANTASPTFTGTPAAPTASAATNTTQIATTAFVRAEVSALVDSAPSTLDTLNELAAALNDDPDFATTVTASIGTKAANSHVNTLLSNTNAYIATKLNSSSYTAADVQVKAALANTNSYIATKLATSSYTAADVQVKAALANTNSYIATVQSDVDANEATELLHLSNTNSYIATKLNSSSYTAADVQVKAALANTNSYIATKLNSSSYTAADVQSKAALANTNSYIATVQSDVDANEATERAALSNTNSYIATKLNSSSYTAADVQAKAALANTNAYIATKLATSSYTTADVQSKAALANTNSYIGTKLSTVNNGDWSGTDLSVGNGGTGASTFTDGGIIYGNGTAALSVTAAPAGADEFLVSTGAGTWGLESAASARTSLGLGTAALVNTGTSGTNVPLLDGTNTWSGVNSFTGTIQTGTGQTRGKLSVWSSATYGIGMGATYTYGGLGGYAMTFQMNDDSARGFWWGDATHTNAQGAMALTTDGKLSVAHSARIGYGETDTTTPGATYLLDVSGDVQIDGDLIVTGSSPRDVFEFSGHIGDEMDSGLTPVYLTSSASFPFTINSLTAKNSAGAVVINVKINTTSVTGLSAVTTTTSFVTTNATAANVVSAGDNVSLTLTGVAATDRNLAFTLKCTRTG